MVRVIKVPLYARQMQLLKPEAVYRLTGRNYQAFIVTIQYQPDRHFFRAYFPVNAVNTSMYGVGENIGHLPHMEAPMP